MCIRDRGNHDLPRKDRSDQQVRFSLAGGNIQECDASSPAIVIIARLRLISPPGPGPAASAAHLACPGVLEWLGRTAAGVSDGDFRRRNSTRKAQPLSEAIRKGPPLPPGEGRGEGKSARDADRDACFGCNNPHHNPLPEGEGTCDGCFPDSLSETSPTAFPETHSNLKTTSAVKQTAAKGASQIGGRPGAIRRPNS